MGEGLNGKAVGVDICVRDKMEVVAINEKENIRVVKSGDMFYLQTLISQIFGRLWNDSEMVKEEWIASKWILKYGMKVSSDYPTIDEIREKQKEEKK